MNGSALAGIRAVAVVLGGVLFVVTGVSHFVPALDGFVTGKLTTSVVGFILVFAPGLGRLLKELLNGS